MSKQLFSSRLLDWYDQHGRHTLPWQTERNPYHVWISETMLQQTQVQTVIPYFERFIQRYPDVQSLADTSTDELMSHWAGLGYYRRAMFLFKAANIIVEKHQGMIPNTLEALLELPGIGRSTAGAILSLGFDLPFPILDGNVKRVLTRYFGIEGWPDHPTQLKQLWTLATELLPDQRCRDYGQATMDLGALICHKTNPHCVDCPFYKACATRQSQKFTEIPGKRPRIKVKKKTLYALLSRNHQGAYYVCKQSQEGLWPNLWTFPLEESAPTSHQLCDTIKAFKHQLTHYQLTIVPIWVSPEDLPKKAHAQWLSQEAFAGFGFNKPSDKILAKLNDHAPISQD